MAIDDVISNFETQVSNGSRLDVRPASGDEWLVTAWFLESGLWKFNTSGGAGSIRNGLWGSSTSVAADMEEIGFSDMKWLVTNAEYYRLLNGTGGTASAGYSAIKTKD